MKVFIIGVSGAVGRLLVRDLAERGDDVAGLVRREEQRADLSRWDADARVGELVEPTADSLAASTSELDWLILRPSLLTDRAGTGRVPLGPAQPHDEIAREDVAATLAVLLHEPRIGRQILELNQGSTPIVNAVQASIRGGPPGRARRGLGDGG